jgi:hypothetical protein
VSVVVAELFWKFDELSSCAGAASEYIFLANGWLGTSTPKRVVPARVYACLLFLLLVSKARDRWSESTVATIDSAKSPPAHTNPSYTAVGYRVD